MSLRNELEYFFGAIRFFTRLPVPAWVGHSSEALASSPASAEEILKQFGDEVATTGGTIDQYIRFNGLFDISINSNTDRIDRHNESITRAEDFIAKQEEQLRQRSANGGTWLRCCLSSPRQ